MKFRLANALGIALLVVSALAILQTARELLLFLTGERAFEERPVSETTFNFAGRSVSIVDDQPVDTGYSEIATQGLIDARIDGKSIAVPVRAEIRRHHRDSGRYYGWYQAWIFRSRSTNDSALYLARRVQSSQEDSPEFEITVVDRSGKADRRVLRAWELGWDYRVFRSTQLIRQGTWNVMPLTLSSVIGIFPLFLLIFPVGTTVLGILLMKHKREFKPIAA